MSGYRYALGRPGAGVQHLILAAAPASLVALCRLALPEAADVSETPHPEAPLCRGCRRRAPEPVPLVIPHPAGGGYLVSTRIVPGQAPEVIQHVVGDTTGPPPRATACGRML